MAIAQLQTGFPRVVTPGLGGGTYGFPLAETSPNSVYPRDRRNALYMPRQWQGSTVNVVCRSGSLSALCSGYASSGLDGMVLTTIKVSTTGGDITADMAVDMSSVHPSVMLWLPNRYMLLPVMTEGSPHNPSRLIYLATMTDPSATTDRRSFVVNIYGAYNTRIDSGTIGAVNIFAPVFVRTKGQVDVNELFWA